MTRSNAKLQYGLKALMITFLFVSVCLSGLSIKIGQLRAQRKAVERLQRSSFVVTYSQATKNNCPTWLADALEIDTHSSVQAVRSLGVFERALAPISFNTRDCAELKCLMGLTVLVLENTSISDAELATLSDLTELEELGLGKTCITDYATAHLMKLTNLRRLDLHDTDIGHDGLEFVLPMRSLESINLSGTKVTDSGIKSLQHLSKLWEVDLSGTQLTDAAVPHLRRLSRLEYVDLSGTRITEDAKTSLFHSHPSLRMIVVSDGRFMARAETPANRSEVTADFVRNGPDAN